MINMASSFVITFLALFGTFQTASTSIDKAAQLADDRDSPTQIRRPMRIAQVCSPWLPVPPKKYGGTERVVYFLIEELVRTGHNVTLFGTSDSNETSATLFSHPQLASLKPRPGTVLWEVYLLWILEQVRRHADEFDVIHFHTTEQHSAIHAFSRRTVTTMHSKLDWPHLEVLLDTFNTSMPFVSISNDQRTHTTAHPWYAGTVYHGVPRDQYSFNPKPGSRSSSGDKRPYLAWLGRFSHEKAPDMAIRIAVEAGIPLKLAGIVVDDERGFWTERVKPLIDEHPELIEYVGELNDTEKNHFLGNALAMLFSSEWAEPFGLVLIEAMACGTPVVGRSRGSVPEIVDPGVTGLLFNTFAEGVEAVKRVGQLDRARVRRTFERRFSVEAMADGYERIYTKLVEGEEERRKMKEEGEEMCRD